MMAHGTHAVLASLLGFVGIALATSRVEASRLLGGVFPFETLRRSPLLL